MVNNPTTDAQNDAVPYDGLENVRLLAELMRGGGSHANALGVDHLAHDAAGAVGGANQYLGLVDRQRVVQQPLLRMNR